MAVALVGLVGFAGAGKSTAAAFLAEAGYVVMSFADTIKDCLTVVFGWPRHLLDGKTAESRRFRETVDPWWAERLGIPGFTPRFAMTRFGTDVMRRHLHDDLWTLCAERRRARLGFPATAFDDVRHPSEMALVRRGGGRLLRIRRGAEPPWFDDARRANAGDQAALRRLDALGVHDSERAWIGQPLDGTVANDGCPTRLRLDILRACA